MWKALPYKVPPDPFARPLRQSPPPLHAHFLPSVTIVSSACVWTWCKWNQTVCLCLCLASFAQQNFVLIASRILNFTITACLKHMEAWNTLRHSISNFEQGVLCNSEVVILDLGQA